MICNACKQAADRGLQGWEAHQAAGCRGGSTCDCMHRVGPIEQHVNAETVAQIRAAGSPPTP